MTALPWLLALGGNDLHVALLVSVFGVATIVGGVLLGRLSGLLAERELTTWGGALQGGAAGTAARGRLVDAGHLEAAMAVCAVGLAAVGWFARRA